MAASKKTTHQARKETSFKARNYSKFGETRKFKDGETEAIATELGKGAYAPIEGYQPLFKKIHEVVGLEQRY